MTPQVVLITGARSGFGLVTAVEAARRGHVVYAGLRDLETADRLVEATAGLAVHPIQLDVTSAEQRAAAVARMLADHGRIDAVVNNAGVALGGFLEQVDDDELRKVFEVNVFAAWAMTRAALPAMRAQRGGTVVMVSSMSGRMAIPGLGAYAASKFALEGMSESWRHELVAFGVRMVVIEPGAYATDIFHRNRTVSRNARDPASPYAPLVERMDDKFAEVVKRTAGDPVDVAVRICDAIEHPSPAFRHPMGPGTLARRMLLALAPFWAIEQVLLRVLKLPDQLRR